MSTGDPKELVRKCRRSVIPAFAHWRQLNDPHVVLVYERQAQPRENPAVARAWIPAKSMPE